MSVGIDFPLRHYHFALMAGRKKCNSAWAAIPEGWAGSKPKGKVWCHFPLSVPAEGGEDVDRCEHTLTGNLRGLLSHIKNAHSKTFPDVCERIFKEYKSESPQTFTYLIVG